MRLARYQTALMMAPALLMLTLVFALPIAWFLVAVLGELGSLPKLTAEVADMLSSRAVRMAMLNTNLISATVTVLTLIIGYPLAYALTTARGFSFVLIICAILLPYFTSVVVRTYSWMVLLGRNGLINQTLIKTGIIGAPLDLMYNRLGVIIGMTYVLLPYMVLALYAAMRSIDPSLMRAARGLGAGAVDAFRWIFFPLTLHGVVAGTLTVFILAIGFFVTPALMGGPADVMIATLIEREVEISLNWPLAALMSIALLAATLMLFAIYQRLTDVQRMLG
jgi:ABC-type spermidine/putrescine transport system permease subunit I